MKNKMDLDLKRKIEVVCSCGNTFKTNVKYLMSKPSAKCGKCQRKESLNSSTLEELEASLNDLGIKYNFI